MVTKTILLAGVAGIAVCISGAAGAVQCASTAPATPGTPAALNSTISNTTLGTNAPYILDNDGVTGCTGIEGADDKPTTTGAGGPGSAAGSISATLTNVQVIGASGVDYTMPEAAGLILRAAGGTGGLGGFGGSPYVVTIVGGNGGAAGAAGTIVLSFTGSVDMRSINTAGDIGVLITATGGGGTFGGGVGGQGVAGSQGGTGGAGGAGGVIQAGIAADIIVSAAGVVADASGGDGGEGGSDVSAVARVLTGGYGGAGGTGGIAGIGYDGTLTSRSSGLIAIANGGRGGNSGGLGGAASGAETKDGGAGGNGGLTAVDVGAGALISVDGSGLTPLSVLPNQGAVVVAANGGNGGTAQPAVIGTLNGKGGSGGDGGAGGTARTEIYGSIIFGGQLATPSDPGYAVQVYANGGIGGAGGDGKAISGEAGGGGLAGAGGNATLTLGNASQAGTVRSDAYLTNAALVQSIGGGGGGGGAGSINVIGGTGAAGGSGSAATANLVNGQLIAGNAASSALIIQSIGGGGGVGGDETGLVLGAQLSIGGNGGLGGDGGNVAVNIASSAVVASLSQIGDFGILAQSIGGSGGLGGSATTTGTGIFVMTVGGDGGKGAPAGAVNINNDGIVTSYGDFGAAIQAQSIGGGGGDGGAAVSSIASLTPTAAVAIGGGGGSGGAGNNVIIYNTSNGQITTYGSDAYGVIAQSVGGGGGTGGISAARAVSFSPTPDIPAISISVSLGGRGGTGNVAGTAAVNNAGVISTAGEGSIGLFSQSVGGGGGAGGDSTAQSYSGGSSETPLSITSSVSIGGSGGSGGAGGLVGLDNSGLVLTLGTDATALFAQSVGGGGGLGSAGDSSAVSSDPDSGNSLAVSVALGGTGGTGGNGGQVIIKNEGSVVTHGDGADGFFGQSVGGGGGSAGGGVANAGGNQLSVSVGVGGSGGAAGDGGGISATNSGAILTYGVDAKGMMAQSVGGGGGEAGKAGSTAGGVDNVAKSTALYDTIAGGLNVGADVTTVVDKVFKFGAQVLEVTKTLDELGDIFGFLKPGDNTKGLVKNLDLALSVGGSGGAAGNGGAIELINTGQILTRGAQADGIYAQSVGGGGGKGGDASSAGSSYDDTRNQVSIGVAGGGGNAGNGGTISVINGAAATITTRGVMAFGVLGQSVGGGGGTAAQSTSVNGSLRSFAIQFNRGAGALGAGGAVTLENVGAIVTQGKNGIGLFGQSVGGGGGLVETTTSDMTFNPDELINNPQGRVADVHSFVATFGGGANSQGDGGAVNITNSGTIATSLLDAHGIVAQSIGGGGGATIGGQLVGGLNNGASASNTNDGNGGAVDVVLSSGSSITTHGDGAFGILAQSIGGGGGLAGDPSSVTSATTGLTGGVIVAGTGNGGNVSINLTGASISTSGAFAPAVVAQSIGGGGGLLAQNGQLQLGTANGVGRGGDLVSVTLVNSSIKATGGQGSPAIILQNSYGLTPNGSSVVNIDAASRVESAAVGTAPFTYSGGTIALLNGQGNWVNNSGTIIGGIGTGFAITSQGQLQINNSGTILGDVYAVGTSNINNNAGGTMQASAIYINGGTFNNAGNFIIGDNFGALIDGNFVNTGQITASYDPQTGLIPALSSNDTATFNGSLVITNAKYAQPGLTRPVLTALSFTGMPTVSSDSSVLHFTPVAQQGGLALQVDADFTAGAQSLSASSNSLADYLGRAFKSGDAGTSAGLSKLIDKATPTSNTLNLASLSGQSLLAVSAIRYETSIAQAHSLYTCPDRSDASSVVGENSCAWFRVQGVWSDRSAGDNYSGYHWKGVEMTLGGQRRVSDDWSVGASFSYQSGKLRQNDNLARVKSDAVNGAVSLKYQDGPLTLVGATDLGYTWAKSRRYIPLAQAYATAKPGELDWGLHGRGAWRFGAALYFEPTLDLDLTYLSVSDYTEKGAAPFNLNVHDGRNWVFSATPSARIGTRITLSKRSALDVFIGAGPSFTSGNTLAADARFADAGEGIGRFRTNLETDDIFARVSAGVRLIAGSKFDLKLQYDGRFSSRETWHAAEAKAIWWF